MKNFMKTLKLIISLFGCKPETWWGVYDEVTKKTVYLYRDEHSARNQANRTNYHSVRPRIVIDQTPYSQDILIENRRITPEEYERRVKRANDLSMWD